MGAFLGRSTQSLLMTKPHVLVVLVDQHRFDCVGINGNAEVITPHLDALAKDGVSYTNCFSTFPLCTPARYSLLTGLYVRQHQGCGNRFTIPKELTTFAKDLRNDGYQTDYVGKLHSSPTYAEIGFDHLLLSEQEGPGRYEDDYHRALMEKGIVDFTDMQDQVQDLRKVAPQSYLDDFGTEPSSLSADDYSTGWIGRNALAHIQKWKDATSPQLLMVGFIKPHHPFDAPFPWNELYDPEGLTHLPGWIDAGLPRDNDYYKGFFENNSLSEPVAKRILAQYYASISHIDAFVGHFVALLKKLGLYDDTLIIYVSDHGEYMGYHHLMLKNNYIYDPVIKVPLIVKYPQGSPFAPPQESPTDDKLVSLIDATATIYTVAGVPIPASLQSIIQPLHSCNREVVFAENTKSTMIRTKDFKLIYSEYEPSVFFDLRNDPYELENVIAQPEYVAVVKKMTEEVKAWIEAEDFEITNFSPLDSWAVKQGLRYEEKEEMAKVEQYLRSEYEKEMKKRIQP
jgi:arylsulfatase A-like enzyme